MNVKLDSPNSIVVVHLSSTAIHTVVGQIYDIENIHIMGVASVPSHDFYNGVIINRDRLKANIKQSIQQAEDMANCRVNSVWLSFATSALKSSNGMGEVSIEHEKIEVRDMVLALTNAKAQLVSDDMYLMSYVQQGVILDNSPSMVDDAIGMQAEKLTVLYHLMMMPVKHCQNLQQLLQDCDVGVEQMIFDAVSSAEYGLLSNEKVQGACFIDMGASNTNVCVYRENKLVYTHCYEMGGNDVTRDIASELDIAPITAENIKKTQGNINLDSIDTAEFFEIRDVNAEKKQESCLYLYNIIESCYRKMLVQIKEDLDKKGLSEFLYDGYVMTGGATKIAGFVPYARNVFSAKVHIVNQNNVFKVGLPFNGYSDETQEHIFNCLKNPSYQTALGVLLYSQSDTFFYSKRSDAKTIKNPSNLERIWKSAKKLFRKNF